MIKGLIKRINISFVIKQVMAAKTKTKKKDDYTRTGRSIPKRTYHPELKKKPKK